MILIRHETEYCEDCGEEFPADQIKFTDGKGFHPKCPVHWLDYCDHMAGDWEREADDFRRQEAGICKPRM